MIIDCFEIILKCRHSITFHIRAKQCLLSIHGHGRHDVIYRVIHKSVKHFKNSQQIKYSTDHVSSYADRERNSPSSFFFYIFHRFSMYPPLVIRQTSMRQSISFHTRVSISRSTRATAAAIRLRRSWRLSGSGGTKTVSFTNPHKKKSQRVKSGDRGGHRVNASSSCPVRPILNAIFATTVSQRQIRATMCTSFSLK